ncbi:ABC transporter substrate-binding protein [Endozoicomonas sp. Mp262]|uniref:ABC transporter substrate-binding protein n=1 Tax=Endozoicomonas sp. Mp262 TaxID=2919499 RepID=UPI0021D8025C
MSWLIKRLFRRSSSLAILLLALSGLAMARPLVLALGGEPDQGFDPVTGWGVYGAPLFQSTLLQRDNQLNLKPDLAEDITVSDNGLVWHARLRKGVRFSDGQPLTSRDVVFTFRKIMTSGGRNDLTMLSSVEAVGDDQVQFTLKQPSSLFWGRLATTAIVPAHLYDKNYAVRPVGSGPFRLVQWQRGRQLIVEPNPYYYGAKSDFEKITFLFGSQESLVMRARAGGVDVVSVPLPQARLPFGSMKEWVVKSVDIRGISFPVKQPFVTGDHRQAGNKVTSDLAIRKAINLVVNRELLASGLLENYGHPAWGLAEGLPWDQQANRFRDNQVGSAIKLLEKAGWIYDSNKGLRVKEGVPARFELWYASGDAIRQGLALAVADRVKRLGIQMEVKSAGWDRIEQVMLTQPVLFGWGSHDPMELYLQFHSRNAGKGFYNAAWYQNPKVDHWLDKAISSGSEADAWRFFQKAQYDGKGGPGFKGDSVWAWLVNLDHVYRVNPCLDLGESRIEPHEHGWPITANILEWHDSCQARL